MTDAADRKPGRAARVAGIALALGVFGALGHVAAEGWSAGEEASVAAPPVA